MKTKNVLSVFRISHREILQSRPFYALIFFTVALLFISFLAAKLSFTNQQRIVFHLGYAFTQIMLVGMGSLLAAGLIEKDFDSRRIELFLSRPMTRFEYFWGKLIALFGVVGLSWFLASLFLLGISYLLGLTVQASVGIQLLFLLILSWLIAVVTLALGAVLRPVVAFLGGVSVFILGKSHEQMAFLLSGQSGLISGEEIELSLSGKIMLALIPDLAALDLKLGAVYGVLPSGLELAWRAFYGVLWIGFFALLGSGFLIQRRQMADRSF